MKNVATQISPRRLSPSNKETQLRKKIKLLQEQLRRKEKKICNITDLLGHLKNQGRMTKELENELIKRFSGLKLELFQSELINTSNSKFHKKYSPIIKEFASTLYFYSLKAYNFVRTELNLPHEATLRKWVAEISCEAGFLSCVFEFLSNESKKVNYLTNVAFIMDSMSIRSQVAVEKKMYLKDL